MNERWELLEGRQRRLRLRGAEEGARRKEDYLAVKNGVGSKIQGQGRAWFCPRAAAGVRGAEGAEVKTGRVACRAPKLVWHGRNVVTPSGRRVCMHFTSGGKAPKFHGTSESWAVCLSSYSSFNKCATNDSP